MVYLVFTQCSFSHAPVGGTCYCCLPHVLFHPSSLSIIIVANYSLLFHRPYHLTIGTHTEPAKTIITSLLHFQVMSPPISLIVHHHSSHHNASHHHPTQIHHHINLHTHHFQSHLTTLHFPTQIRVFTKILNTHLGLHTFRLTTSCHLHDWQLR